MFEKGLDFEMPFWSLLNIYFCKEYRTKKLLLVTETLMINVLHVFCMFQQTLRLVPNCTTHGGSYFLGRWNRYAYAPSSSKSVLACVWTNLKNWFENFRNVGKCTKLMQQKTSFCGFLILFMIKFYKIDKLL